MMLSLCVLSGSVALWRATVVCWWGAGIEQGASLREMDGAAYAGASLAYASGSVGFCLAVAGRVAGLRSTDFWGLGLYFSVMTTLLLTQGRVIDPANRIDRDAEVLIVDGKIAEV